MKYGEFEICGKNLGRHSGFPEEADGFNRICYGKPGHRGYHGDEAPRNPGDTDVGQGVLLLSDAQLAEALK